MGKTSLEKEKDTGRVNERQGQRQEIQASREAKREGQKKGKEQQGTKSKNERKKNLE